MDRLQLAQLRQTLILAPGEEGAGSAAVGGAGASAANVNGEEFEEAARGRFPCPADQGRNGNGRLVGEDQFTAHGFSSVDFALGSVSPFREAFQPLQAFAPPPRDLQFSGAPSGRFEHQATYPEDQ